MGLEATTFISGLVTTNPVGPSDDIKQGDDHLRLIKSVLKATFPDADHAIYLDRPQADIVSATSTAIGAMTTNFVRITGTTAITSFDSVAAGIWRFVRFSGVLTLTHNATSLILPGAANVTTAANDTMLAMSLGSGNWMVLWYQKASGVPVVNPSLDDLLGTISASQLETDAVTTAKILDLAVTAAKLAADAVTTTKILNGAITIPKLAASVYAEGTWVPVLRFGGGTTGITYAVQIGSYVRLGDTVHIWGTIELSAKGSSTGAATISGLPFVAETLAGMVWSVGAAGKVLNMSAMRGTVSLSVASGASILDLWEEGNGGDGQLADSNAVADNRFTNTSKLYFNGSYKTDAA